MYNLCSCSCVALTTSHSLTAAVNQLRVVAISTMNDLDLQVGGANSMPSNNLLQFVEAVFSVGDLVRASNLLQEDYYS